MILFHSRREKFQIHTTLGTHNANYTVTISHVLSIYLIVWKQRHQDKIYISIQGFQSHPRAGKSLRVGVYKCDSAGNIHSGENATYLFFKSFDTPREDNMRIKFRYVITYVVKYCLVQEIQMSLCEHVTS